MKILESFESDESVYLTDKGRGRDEKQCGKMRRRIEWGKQVICIYKIFIIVQANKRKAPQAIGGDDEWMDGER